MRIDYLKLSFEIEAFKILFKIFFNKKYVLELISQKFGFSPWFWFLLEGFCQLGPCRLKNLALPWSLVWIALMFLLNLFNRIWISSGKKWWCFLRVQRIIPSIQTNTKVSLLMYVHFCLSNSCHFSGFSISLFNKILLH